MTMKLRVYRDEDFGPVTALWRDAGLDHAPNDPAYDIPLMRDAPNCELFLAEDEGKLLGSVMVGHDGHRAWVYRLAVVPEQRKRGVAKALMRQAEGWAALRGMRKIQLMIRPENKPVVDFYAHLGYVTQPRTIMAKWLSDADREKAPKIEVVITMLEMTQRPANRSIAKPPAKLAILRAEKPPIRFFRYLYDNVGDPWFWYYRRYMSDGEIAAIVHDPKVEIYVFYVEGSPAGYVEIDRRDPTAANINHFGLMSEYIGRGLGPFLLNFAIETAWASDPPKVTIDTCTLDHPSALPMYQKYGFQPTGKRSEWIEDPRWRGVVPSNLEPRLPQ